MIIIFTWKELIVYEDGIEIARCPASCNVRNEMNGRRPLHDPKQVQYTIPKSMKPMPYMPRQYPSGIFKITEIEWTDDPEYAPVKIRTTAKRDVFVWALDKYGGYDYRLDEIQTDTAYHIHNTDSKTTLGCIRCTESERLAKLIESVLDKPEPVFLEVL